MRPAIFPRGALTEPDPDAPDGRTRIVYQRCAPGTGNVPGVPGRRLQRRAYHIPADPRTPMQLALRARFAAATAAWQALDPYDRQDWRDRASSRGPTGYMLFVSAYCRAHPVDLDGPLFHPAALVPAAQLAPVASPALPGTTAPAFWSLTAAALAPP
jgi:hypothetical protein